MNHTCEHRIEFLEAPAATNKPTIFGLRKKLQKTLARILKPNFEVMHLNDHLRRDAGIDEHELERMRIAGSPLIR